MILRRLYDDGLAQASYILGCEGTRDAIVIDPNRDVRQYLEAADRDALRITAVTETHIHADFVSGARAVAAVTGAALVLSAEGGAEWQYAFASENGARLVRDGDTIDVGSVRLTVMHTPGHTPEHISFLVTDRATASVPMGAITGDFLFAGEVGRPDLLERAAGVAGAIERGARDLFRSLARFAALPDHLQIWPGHGAGSACGKSLGAMPQSTLGYERIANWALAPQSEEAFMAAVLAGQPEPPAYFARMKRVNRDGPPASDGSRAVERVRDAELSSVVGLGALVVDTRASGQFADRYVPGTINIPFNKSFATWAGWLVSYERPVYLIAADGDVEPALRALRLIGLDDVAGIFAPSAIDGAFARASIPQIGVDELDVRMARGDVTVIDVRGDAEWSEGHLPGAANIPVGKLVERLARIPRDKPVVTQCQGGTRSAIAASVLLKHGIPRVINLQGGFSEWERDGRPVERA
ncbi:MAG: MBL fold metallo-hydrolase [Gemmatimonadaceae bacterium]